MITNLLIVDDSAPIRKILQRILYSSQLPVGNVLEAGDGIEALEVLRTNAIDLVVTGMKMPNMDGMGLLAEMRGHETWKAIPVVVIVSGAGRAELEAVKLGASTSLRKPFTTEHLKERLGRFLTAA